MPVGFLVLGPGAAVLLQRLIEPGGALASTAGGVLGTGAGRGLGLMYVLFGLLLALAALCARGVPALARFDAEVPDAEPDDLVGLQALRARRSPETAAGPGQTRFNRR
jgi:hypothetical protein